MSKIDFLAGSKRSKIRKMLKIAEKKLRKVTVNESNKVINSVEGKPNAIVKYTGFH